MVRLSALITKTILSTPRLWTATLEHTLHKLLRDTHTQGLTPETVSQVIKSLPHKTLALGFFNWASQHPNFTHTPLTYHSILKTLSQGHSRHFNHILNLLRDTRKTPGLSLQTDTYDCVLRALLQNGRKRDALQVMAFAGRLTGLNGSVLNSLLAGLDLRDAKRVFDEMCHTKVPFSTVGFGVFLWRWCKERGLDGVFGMLEVVGTGVNGSVVAVFVVDGLCKGGRVFEAFRVLDELRGRGFKPDFVAYRVVAEGFRVMGRRVEMETVLKRKRKFGVKPRERDYKGVILELVQEGRVSEAKELGEVIVSGDFPVDDHVLNTLIGSVSDFDPKSALGFFDFMVGKGRFPSVVSMRGLSGNLCKHGMVGELLDVYEKLSCNGYFSDEESYGMRIQFLCKGGRVREAYGALQEMRKNGFGPCVSLYNSVLDACCKQELLRPAKRLWDEMFASRCTGNLETYNILICKFSEVGQVEDSLRLFYHMLDKGLKPGAMTYASLLGGLCQEGKLEGAIQVFNKSVQQDIMLANNILSTFVSCLCNNGHFISASKLLRGLSMEAGHSDSHVVLLKYLADARELPIATEHINYVHKMCPPLLQDIYGKLLALISSSTKQDQMLQMLNEIQRTFRLSDNRVWNNFESNSFYYS